MNILKYEKYTEIYEQYKENTKRKASATTYEHFYTYIESIEIYRNMFRNIKNYRQLQIQNIENTEHRKNER